MKKKMIKKKVIKKVNLSKTLSDRYRVLAFDGKEFFVQSNQLRGVSPKVRIFYTSNLLKVPAIKKIERLTMSQVKAFIAKGEMK